MAPKSVTFRRHDHLVSVLCVCVCGGGGGGVWVGVTLGNLAL